MEAWGRGCEFEDIFEGGCKGGLGSEWSGLSEGAQRGVGLEEEDVVVVE